MKRQVEDTIKANVVTGRTLEKFVGFHVKRASNVIQADLARTLAPFELRMLTFSVLAMIVDNPGLRQSQLADAMNMERPNLVLFLDELEQRKLIIRTRVETDRRAYALMATPLGQRIYDQALAATTVSEAKLLESIDPDKLAIVVEVMETIQKLQPNKV